MEVTYCIAISGYEDKFSGNSTLTPKYIAHEAVLYERLFISFPIDKFAVASHVKSNEANPSNDYYYKILNFFFINHNSNEKYSALVSSLSAFLIFILSLIRCRLKNRRSGADSIHHYHNV